jgi:cytoskeletal protein CcmA (bactofilin family)
MALWKEPTSSKPSFPPTPEPAPAARFDPIPSPPAAVDAPVIPVTPNREKARAESLIAVDLTIEGRIEGTGHVRIAGRFKGDIDVKGDLTIELGATVTGSVRAEKVTIAGELVGNIEAASRVDLLQTGALTGDIKAGTLTVASGARMRGQADFGWEDGKPHGVVTNGNGHAKGERNGAA